MQIASFSIWTRVAVSISYDVDQLRSEHVLKNQMVSSIPIKSNQLNYVYMV